MIAKGNFSAYMRRRRDLREAESRLEDHLDRAVREIEDRTLVRAEITELRVKKFTSLLKKARRKGWTFEQALQECGDLVGGRVVCNNVEDVYRFAELLKECLPGGPWSAYEVQDQIAVPSDDGYRALHVNFRLPVGNSSPLQPETVPCEVQVLTRLQNAWAELVHDDIYKHRDKLPTDLRARANDLAEVLAASEKIAAAIRRRVQQELVAPENQPDLTNVTEDGLAYIFRDVFGRSPPDYVVRKAMNLCEDLGIESLAGLPAILGQADFRNNVADAYLSIVGMRPQVEEAFQASLVALVRGKRRALDGVRRRARRDWREIEEIARREELAGFPATADEMLEGLESSGSWIDVQGMAEALGAAHDCDICGTTIVEPDAFAEAAAQHYGLIGDEADRFQERVQTAIRNSDTEIGGFDEGRLCAYHADMALKDD